MYSYQNNLVSLVTPGWNGARFVHRLLDSILVQTYRPIEYIYVDDGSTDGTADIVLSYKDKFERAGIEFKYIRQDNKGICEALMTGFQYVKGKYLSTPEYDDVLLPESVEKKVKYLTVHPDCAVVTAEAWIVPEDNLMQRDKLISHENPNRFDRNHFYQALNGLSIFNAACQMIRMDYFDITHKDRKIYSSRMLPNQQILLPIYYHYNRGFIEEPLSLFVNRYNSLSKHHSFEDQMEALDEYIKILTATLDSIEMPKEDCEFCKRIVRKNTNMDYIRIAFAYRKKELYNLAFRYLERQNELSEIPEPYKNYPNDIEFRFIAVKNSILRRLNKKCFAFYYTKLTRTFSQYFKK